MLLLTFRLLDFPITDIPSYEASVSRVDADAIRYRPI